MHYELLRGVIMKNGLLKKICAVSLAACMLTGAGYVCAGSIADAGITASADELIYSDNYVFATHPCHCDYVWLERYEGSERYVFMPSECDNKEVRWIGQGAFYDNDDIFFVELPSTLTFIEEYAFAKCDSLTYVTIPNSVTSIYDHAFEGSKNVTIRGAAGSYAEIYAKKHNIPFSAVSFPLELRTYLSTESELIPGDTIYVSGKASGGKMNYGENYQYAVYYKLSTAKKWTTAQNYSENGSVSFTAKHSGTYDICVKAKDKAGKVVKTYLQRTVYPKFKNKSTISATEIKLGQKVYVERVYQGGIGEAEFEVFYKNDNQTKWTKATNLEGGNIVIKPKHRGTYTVVVRGTYRIYEGHDEPMRSPIYSKKTFTLKVN